MKYLVIFLLWLQLPAWVNAEITEGSKQAWFESANGDRVKLGDVELTRDGAGWNLQFSIAEASYSDQFLSMRPFKCLDGVTMYCRLAYPYEKNNRVEADDWMDLEYEFLFIVRSPKDYGIDPYNGRYYVLSEQHGKLVGEPKAVDLNILAAPPEAGVTYPITETELDFIEVERERFIRLVIE